MADVDIDQFGADGAAEAEAETGIEEEQPGVEAEDNTEDVAPEEGKEEETDAVEEEKEEEEEVDSDPFKEIGEEEEDETDLDDEDRKSIDARIDKKAGEQLRALTIDREVDRYMFNNPELEKYESKIRTLAKDKRMSSLTVDAIATAAVGRKALMKMGASMSKKANTKAAKAAVGGGTRRVEAEGKMPDVSKMSREEFKAYENKALGRA